MGYPGAVGHLRHTPRPRLGSTQPPPLLSTTAISAPAVPLFTTPITVDSLNHVMRLDELEQVFRGVFAVLDGGGYFVFDLNMEEGFRSRWRGSFEFVEDDHVCVVRSSHDTNEKTGRLDVTLFELKGSGWVRTDFPLIQRWYEEREIRDLLRKVGFGELQSLDENEPILEGSMHEGRMFFVARKGAAHQPRDERQDSAPTPAQHHRNQRSGRSVVHTPDQGVPADRGERLHVVHRGVAHQRHAQAQQGPEQGSDL